MGDNLNVIIITIQPPVSYLGYFLAALLQSLTDSLLLPSQGVSSGNLVALIELLIAEVLFTPGLFILNAGPAKPDAIRPGPWILSAPYQNPSQVSPKWPAQVSPTWPCSKP